MAVSLKTKLGERIEDIVASSRIAAFMSEKLSTLRTNDDLLAFFHRFTLYNAQFPGGVASLAGAVHVRTDLFTDETEPLRDNADRSSIIASNIIFAAEDEFATRNRTVRITHRLMAQEFLRETAAFVGISANDFNTRFAGDNDYLQKAKRLRDGYRIGRFEDEGDIFRAIGFHLGSERLADIEFNTLNDILSARFPEFVAHMREKTGAHGLGLYGWVSTHTTVEEEHFEFSLLGAEQALEFYNGKRTRTELEAMLEEGFQEFVAFQRLMFGWLQ